MDCYEYSNYPMNECVVDVLYVHLGVLHKIERIQTWITVTMR